MEQQNLESNQPLTQISLDEAKREKSKRIKIAFLAFVVGLLVVAGILLLLPQFKIDKCLDHGGRWDDESSRCVFFEPADDDSASNLSDSLIDTSNWQTYRNDEFGFELKHPSGWITRKISLENFGTVIEIGNQQTDSSLSIIKNSNPKNLSLDEWFKEATLINGRPTVKAGAKPVTINGAKAYRLDTQLPPPNPYFEIVGIADEQQNIFTIHANYEVLEHGEILNQILSTFRFVE